MSISMSWVPVRRGSIYCSRACGSNCTHREYLNAVTKGTRLAQALGPGWVPHIWENMGWFYSAQKGVCEVHPTTQGRKIVGYTAFLNSAKQFLGKGKSPRAAADEAVILAKKAAAQIAKEAAEVTD